MSSKRRRLASPLDLPADMICAIAAFAPLWGANLSCVSRAWRDALAPTNPVRLEHATANTRILVVRAMLGAERGVARFLARSFPRLETLVILAVALHSDELKIAEGRSILALLRSLPDAGFAPGVSFLFICPRFFRWLDVSGVRVHERPPNHRDHLFISE